MLNDDLCLQFAVALTDCFAKEEDRQLHNYKEIVAGQDLTEVFFEMFRAMYVLYQQVAEVDKDAIDLFGFTHLINRIVAEKVVNVEEEAQEDQEAANE